MRKRDSRIAAVVATAAAAALAVYALRPTPAPTAGAVAKRSAEVRTQVIRCTVHIVRHGSGTSAAGPTGSAGSPALASPQRSTAGRTGSNGRGTPAVTRSVSSSGSVAAPSAPPTTSSS